MNLRITLFLASVFALSNVFAQVDDLTEHPNSQTSGGQNAGDNGQTLVNYYPPTTGGLPYKYTDELENANYQDNGTGGNPSYTPWRILPAGVGTLVRLEFTNLGIGAGDSLIGYNDGACPTPPCDIAPRRFDFNANNQAAASFNATMGARGFTTYWYENAGGDAGTGWSARMILTDFDGDQIPTAYPWSGVVAGNSNAAPGGFFASFVDGGITKYVYCGTDVNLDYNLIDNGTDGFSGDQDSYVQRLDSVIVNWNDPGNPGAIDRFANPDIAGHRSGYDATGEARFTTPTAYSYTNPGAYSADVRGVDEIGVFSQNDEVEIIVMGDEPNMYNTPDTIEICDDESRSIFGDISWSYGGYELEVETIEWTGPNPADPDGIPNEFKSSDVELRISSDEYPTEGDPGYDADYDRTENNNSLGDGYVDYIFTYTVTFRAPGANGSNDACFNGVPFSEEVVLRVYKQPNAGLRKSNPEYSRLNKWCPECTEFDLENLFAGFDPAEDRNDPSAQDPAFSYDVNGTWTDFNGNVVPNGIATNRPGPGSYGYRYEVENRGCGSDVSTVIVQVIPAPNSGSTIPGNGDAPNTAVEICEDTPDFDLRALLNGEDNNGKWFYRIDDNNKESLITTGLGKEIANQQFLDVVSFAKDPAKANQFLEDEQSSRLYQFCYTVASQFPGGADDVDECSDKTINACDSVETCVYVRVFSKPFIEPSEVDTSVCQGEPVISLDDFVEEEFRISDGWVADPGNPEDPQFGNAAFFDPSFHQTAGVYTFTKQVRNPNSSGVDICAPEEITVNIEFHVIPEAGQNNTVDICPNMTYNLFDFLSPDAELVGEFIRVSPAPPSGVVTNPTNYDFEPDEGEQVVFTYETRSLTNPSCNPDQATIRVNVNPFPSVGRDTVAGVCITDAEFELKTILGGTADDGGTWNPRIAGMTGIGGTTTFDPMAAGPGTYNTSYVIAANGACPERQADLTLTVYNEPLAGDDADDQLCNVDNMMQENILELSDYISGDANGAIYGSAANLADVEEEFGAIEPVADALVDPMTGQVNVFTLGGGTYNFFYRTHNPGCVSDTAFFEILINQVGFAGRDSFEIVCATEPEFDMRPYLGGTITLGGNSSNPGVTFWDDISEVNDPLGSADRIDGSDVTFDPATFLGTEEFSPDTGYHYRHYVEVEFCPTDSALVVVYASDTASAGIRKTGTDSLVYFCESEAGEVTLMDGLIDDTFTAPKSDANGTTARWTLKGGTSLIPEQLLTEVNITNREDFFTGADSSSFDVKAFIERWEGIETPAGSRNYVGGIDNLTFWEWLKTDRILNFEYRANTSMGNLRLPDAYDGVGALPANPEICPDDIETVFVAVMPDYSERFTLDVDDDQPGVSTSLTICKSITNFNLNQFFTELQRVPRLDIFDIFNPSYDSLRWEGISQPAQDGGAIYQDGLTYFINAGQLNPTKEDPTFDDRDPYAIELVIISGKDVAALDKCGEARTNTPLALDVEKVPDMGGVSGVSNVTLCEGSELVKFYDLVTGIKDPFIDAEHFFRAESGPAAQALRLGQFFNAPDAEPGNYVYSYNNPTEACVSPTVSDYNDPGRTTRPRVFKSTIDITVEAGPDLDGFDQAVNEFDVCSDPGVDLSELFPATNNIDNSGSFSIVSGCGSLEDANDFDLAVYNWDAFQACPTALIRYTVTKPGCPDATLDILLNINERPSPGTSDFFRMCINDDNINILTDVLNQEAPPTATPGGTFRVVSPGTPAGAVTATGTFNPAIAGVGTHVVRYRVGDGNLCEFDSAFATIEVERIRRTGTNGTINACAGQPNIDLFDGLKGFFDRGGLWIPPDDPDVRAAVTGADSSIFRHNFYRQLANPFQTQLVFRYVIDTLCSTDTSQVTVFLTPGATNGDTTVNICNQSQEYNLKDALGFPFQMGGVWRALNGAPIEVSGDDAFIFPENMNNGTFRYRYEVEAECGDTVLIGRTTVTVNIGDNIGLGSDTTVAICYSGIVNLDVVFGKDGEGVWSAGPSVGPALIDGNKFDSSLVTTQLDAYDFFYSVPQTFEGCSDTVATFTLDIRKTPFAGSDTVAFYCDNEGDFPVLNLFPDRTITATDLETFDVSAQIAATNALSGGNFFPNRLPEGLHTITYTREDSECGSDVAVASIYVEAFGGEGDRCGDFDGDGVINKLDLDVDGDGIANVDEGVTVGGITYDPFGNHDNDALYNYQDPDFAVFIGSAFEGVVVAMDADGDGEPNARDLDSDNDLIPDLVEAFGRQTAANVDANRDATTDAVNNDGINNVTLSEAIRNFDATTAPDFLNEDTDGDGIGDIMEGRDHANYSDVTSFVFAPYNAPNGIGTGEPDYRNIDADGDGIEDRFENAGGSLTVVINSNAVAAPGIENTDNVPNFRDLDADGDGITDAREAYLEAGEPGDRDGDGIPNFLDLDSDNDGIADARELGPTEIPRNTDGVVDALYNNDTDTIPDFLDFDSDGDGILDEFEKGDIAFGEDGFNTNDPSITTYVTHSVMITNDAPDYIDLDSDGDRIPDSFEKGVSTGALDTDGDGLFDFADIDSDNDRYLDIYEANGDTLFATNEIITDFVDFDLDGFPDYLDFDSDDDGINDFYEVVNNMAFIDNRPFDTDADGIPDFHDEDSDNDRLLDENERGEGTEGSNSAPRDSDEDGIFDYRSLDSDSDGLIDRLELDGDCDGDGIPNYRDAGDNCKVEPFVPEAFTPNGDGENDFFVIPDAPFFPGSTLQVFNRWGGEVFTMKNYDNTWDGTKEGTALPDGTYFYTFDMGIDQEPITGFVYISRN